MSERDRYEIQMVALSEIGLDPAFQVRGIDPDEVQRLVETWNLDKCEPLWMRRWPASDTRPRSPGCEHAVYQVASGWTRTTAARALGLATLPAVIRELGDLDFRAWAVEGNGFHGKRMTDEEMRVHVEKLSAGGMSQGDIAKHTGKPKGTIHNWLAGRNTNAGRSMRMQQPTSDIVLIDAATVADMPVAWRTAESVWLDARRLAAITGQLNRVLNLGDLTATVAPGEAISWLAEQSPATRRVLAERFEHIAAWWQGMAAHARLAGATSGSAVLQREEVVARGPHEA